MLVLGFFSLARHVVISRVYLEQFQIGKLNLVLLLAVAKILQLVYLVSYVEDRRLVIVTRENLNLLLAELQVFTWVLASYLILNFKPFTRCLKIELFLEKV